MGLLGSRAWPAHAGLPWRVWMIDLAKSYVNEATMPPLVPTGSEVTAGLEVAAVALEYRVAILVAPFRE